jgi:NAD(P)-dependent dehydrogenase (short-subunit alcohol dehydrogenase family)
MDEVTDLTVACEENTLKTAIVTGAARGIGLAITRRFLKQGYRVVMLDIDAPTLHRSFDELASDSALTLVCDVSDPQAVDAAITRVASGLGSIDALVNNAGIATFCRFEDTSHEDWANILATNLSGAFYCSQACLPYLLASGHGGSIVNITSISGLKASTLRTAYGTSKAALAHLTFQMAAELGDQGIRVNAVAPGPVDTAMAKKVHTPEIRADYHQAIPLNRYGTEEEIASVVVFLCGPESAYINGQEIAVDGGFGNTGIGLNTLRLRR